MSEMALVMTEKVNNTLVDGFSMNGKAWFTRYQIGAALEYDDPVRAIRIIHHRHRERLDQFSRVVQFDTPSGKQEGYIYDERGVFEICRWSRQPKADMVMDRLYAMAIQIMRQQTIKTYREELEQKGRLKLPSKAQQRKMLEDERDTRSTLLMLNYGKTATRAEYVEKLREIWGDDRKGFERELKYYDETHPVS